MGDEGEPEGLEQGRTQERHAEMQPERLAGEATCWRLRQDFEFLF
jgi:hypothetical protein